MRPDRLREYIVVAIRLWGEQVSGPILAVVGIIMLVLQVFISDAPTATTVLRWGAGVTLGTAALMALFAQYKAWSLERDKYEAEVAKNGRPEIKGEAANFRPTGVRTEGVSFGTVHCTAKIRFYISACNHRPVGTNMKRLDLNGDLMTPPALFTQILAFKQPGSDPLDTNPSLPFGQHVIIVVEGQIEINGYSLADVQNGLKLDGLDIRLLDGFGDPHRIDIRPGEELTL